MSEPIVIWGAGAIGGTIGAYFQRAGVPVLFVDNVPEHVAAINQAGLRIEGPIEEFSIEAPATTPEDLEGEFNTIALCTKAHHTAPACRQLKPHLAGNGYVVSLQNGLNERTIAAHVGAERTVGAFINFGADYLEPGVIHYAGHGAVVVGELDGKTTERVTQLHQHLKLFDDRAVLTGNINGYLWGKMSYGALLYATALTNESIADALASLPHRVLLIRLAREVLAIAAAEGVHPESFDGYEPAAFLGDDDAAAASLDDLVAHNRKSAKTHSGIWRDLHVRKRPTEVDAQIGPMVEIAAENNIPAPMIARLITLIHDIETGKREPGMDLIDLLGANDHL
ncbi:MAG: ketopantoate reductase family protein [Alphaproteobacteria bacterium]|nr:ketopantoate reductase family protein [Alphaproteobacteria bacterium]